MVNKKFLIIGLGAVASVAIVATPLAIVSKLTYKGDSIKNVQDALSKITNVSFQSGDGDGKINNNVSYSRLKSFYFDSNNKPNDKFVVSNFDFFEQKDKQFEKIDDKSLGNFKIVLDDFQANDTDKDFTIFYHVEATKPNEFGEIVKSEIHKAELHFGVVPQFLLATEAHSKLAEFEKAITSSEAFQAGNTDIQPLTPYSIAQFKASVEKNASTVIRPLALVTESDFANDINSATSSDDAIYLLSKYFNFQDVFGQILQKGDYKFSLVKNPNLSQKPGEGQYVTKVNDAGQSSFRLYLKTEFSDEYKASHPYLPELDAAHIDIINFDLSNDKFKGLFLKPNFTSDWTVKTPTKDDYYTTKPSIEQAASTTATQASVQSSTAGTTQTTPGQKQAVSTSSVTTTASSSTTNEAANPSTSTTSATTDESKVDSSQINVFDFLSHINGTFFATKEERNKFVTSYIDSMLTNGLKPSYHGQNEGVKSLSDKEKDLLFNYNVEVDADSLTLAYDDKEQKPVIKGRLTYTVTGKPTNPEVKGKSQTPLQGSTSLFELDNFKPFEVDTKTHADAYAYKETLAPSSFEDFLFSNDTLDYVLANGTIKDKLLLSELQTAFRTNDNKTIYKLLSNPDYYGLVLNSAKKLDALTKEFNVPSIDAIPSIFKEATSKENIKNNVLNIDSKIFKNDLDVVRFYFALEKQGFTKVAQYLFDILKSTGNIPADSQLDINKPIFEQLSKIALTKGGAKGFKTLSFANSYQLNTYNKNTTTNNADAHGEVDDDDSVDVPTPQTQGSQTNDNQSNDTIDLSSLLASSIDTTISSQIQQGTITSDSKILDLVKASIENSGFTYNNGSFQSVADVVLAFYQKLYSLVGNDSLPLMKLKGNIGYKLEFVATDPKDGAKLAFYKKPSPPSSTDDYETLNIGYRYVVGFVDPKNPGVITHELFKTSSQSLEDIKPFDDLKTPAPKSKESVLDQKIDSVQDFYKTFYLPKEEYENLGAKLVLRYANRKIPRMSVKDLLTELNAPWIQDYYTKHFGKDVKFWVINGFEPDYSSNGASGDDEYQGEFLQRLSKNTSVVNKYDYLIPENILKKAGVETEKNHEDLLIVDKGKKDLIKEYNKDNSVGQSEGSNKFQQNYKEIRLFVQLGKELAKDKPLIIRVYEQK